MKSQFKIFFKRFVSNIKNKPLQRGMITYAITYPTGSYIQQLLNKQQEKIDYSRITKIGIFGSLIIAPGVHCWVTFVNKLFQGNSILHILGKVGLEQIIYAPLFYTVFYFGLTIMDGKSMLEGMLEVKSKAFHTYTIGLMVWPLLQLYNYRYVSDRNRLVFISFFGLLWTVYLSYTKYVLGVNNEETVFFQKSSQAKDETSSKQEGK